MTSRRTFLMKVLPAAGALAVLGSKAMAAPATATEADPQAKALGYVTDVKKVDKAKFPKYAAGQLCNNCQFYQGKPTDASAPCPMLGGKLVASKGWCNVYAKKA